MNLPKGTTMTDDQVPEDVSAQPDDATCLLGAVSAGNRPYQMTPEMLQIQKAASERSDRLYQLERDRERDQINRSRDDSIRTAAVHAALMCADGAKDVETVLASAARIEAFLRGETHPGSQNPL